jgi:hypothetical protein
MGKRSRRERDAVPDRVERGRPRVSRSRIRILQIAAVVMAVAAGLSLVVLLRPSRAGGTGNGAGSTPFTRVGRNGPVFTIAVPRARVSDDQSLLRIAEQISSEEIQSGGSGQISVMIWPDDVPVPKEPPATEFDQSMKTQAAGIFINPKRNIKHMIRFRDGATLSEREFGSPPR